MASVQSMTLDRLLQLEADTVIGGHIDGSGHLILELHDGSTVDAGYALVAITDGSITSAKIADGTIVNADISASAAIAQSKISGLVSDLAGKAATSHTHAASDIDSGVLAIARIPTGTSSTTVSLGNHTHAALANLVVGDSGWTNVSTFFNSWTNFGAGYAPAQYRKLPSGMVALQGLIKSGSFGQVAFVLPSGYRPSARLLLAAVDGNNNGVRLDIDSNGDVYAYSGANNGYYGFAVSFYPG